MKLKEQLKKDRETLKKLDTNKKKRQFIWTYYKLPILTAVFILFVTAVSVISSLRQKDVALYAVLINTNTETADRTYFDRVLQEEDPEIKGVVDLQDNYRLEFDTMSDSDGMTLQVLSAMFGIGDLDFFMAGERVYQMYAEKDAFADLSRLIEKEVLDAWPYGVYRIVNSDGVEIVAGIRFGPGSSVHEAGFYADEVIAGVTTQAENMDEALTLLKAMMKKQ